MAEFELLATPPFADVSEVIGDINLSGLTDRSILQLAAKDSNEAGFRRLTKSGLRLASPEPGRFNESPAGMLIWSAPGQYLLVIERSERPESGFPEVMSSHAWTTDVSDAWCLLELEGSASVQVLERFCQLDVHPSAFNVGMAARTLIDHLGVFLLRTGTDRYMLMGPSSYADTLLHAVTRSARNIRE